MRTRETCAGCGDFVPFYFVVSSGHCWSCYLDALHARRAGLDAGTRRRIADADRLLPNVPPALLRVLTARQRDVANRILCGLSVAALARADGRDERATKALVARIRVRLETAAAKMDTPPIVFATVATDASGFTPAAQETPATAGEERHDDRHASART